MRKHFFRLALTGLVLTVGFTQTLRAQDQKAAIRDAEWQSYKLPGGKFERHFDKSEMVLYRVPADWKKIGDDAYQGPLQASIRIVTEAIGDGMPLASYEAAVLQNLRSLPGGPDALTVRRTTISGIESREVSIDIPGLDGGLEKRLLWLAVHGPTAFAFIFNSPAENTSQSEPYFKAIVESALISYAKDQFEDLDSKEAVSAAPVQPEELDGVLNAINALESRDVSRHQPAFDSFRTLLSQSPATVLEHWLDPRAEVRQAVLAALAASGNHEYDSKLFLALSDPDLLTAEAVASPLAARADIVDLLCDKTMDWTSIKPLYRIWPFLSTDARTEIAESVFKHADLGQPWGGIPAPPPPPPPPSRKTPPPGHPSARPRTLNPPSFTVAVKPHAGPNEVFSMLPLLKDVPISKCSIPIAQIAATEDQRLIISALQVALTRHEKLPLAVLLKLVRSKNRDVNGLAADNIGESASTQDIGSIETEVSRLDRTPATGSTADSAGDPGARLRTSIRKIRFRQQLDAASPDSRPHLIAEGLKDREIAPWVWSRYAADSPAAGTEPVKIGNDLKVSSLGENVFPKDVSLYAAMPRPSEAFGKFFGSLSNIQLDTARDQALYVLLMSALKTSLAGSLGGKSQRTIAETTGIDLSQPITVAVWPAGGAPRWMKSARREAAVFRVVDRERFERLLSYYQRSIGAFSSFPQVLSLSARFIEFFPALLPTIVDMAMTRGFGSNSDNSKEEKIPAYKYDSIREGSFRGLPAAEITQVQADSNGKITTAPVQVAYIGNTAIVASDLETLCEMTDRLESGEKGLSGNPQFASAVSEGGDVVYLSDLGGLFGGAGNFSPAMTERGSLKISESKWESDYKISISAPETARLFRPFDPRTSAAAHTLLPKSTVMYMVAGLDMKLGLPLLQGLLGSSNIVKGLASKPGLDFWGRVLPELEGECGAAVLRVPTFRNGSLDAPWIIFFKLKSGKLADALAAGTAVKAPASPKEAPALKFGETSVSIAIRNGYLVLGRDEDTIKSLNATEHLDETRDFKRSADSAPSSVVAFGGYNMDAAEPTLTGKPLSNTTEAVVNALRAFSRAFHSQSFYITAGGADLDARLSVSLDREGRYSVAELSSRAGKSPIQFAIVESRGVPIVDQYLLTTLKLRIKAKAPGVIEQIAADLKAPHQTVEKTAGDELSVSIDPRRPGKVESVKLPITSAEFAPYLGSTPEIQTEDPTVTAKAREIAGKDTDAWSVAQKLSKWIYTNLKWRAVEPTDAASTLATKEAACLEFSNLFVAMARSLGLPSRVVTGMAYSAGSFGGHAWVEVYAGRWIEIDPTWGTDFVDATHLRESANELTTYAMLNVASMEVTEAPREVEPYQHDPAALIGKVVDALGAGDFATLSSAIDLPALTDKLAGPGTWASISVPDREMFSSYYRLTVADLFRTFQGSEDSVHGRLLSVHATGNEATGLALIDTARFAVLPVKIKVERIGDAWFLTGIVNPDVGLDTISEDFQPAVRTVQSHKTGKPVDGYYSIYGKVVGLTHAGNPQGAIDAADAALKSNPADHELIFLKSLALLALKKTDDAVAIWQQLASGNPPFAPAVLRMASHYSLNKDNDEKKAAGYYEQLKTVEPDDPRSYESLARIYENARDDAKAEAEYREAIKRDASNHQLYSDLAVALCRQERFTEALVQIDESAKHGRSADDAFDDVMVSFWGDDEPKLAESLVEADPARLAHNAKANYHLALIRIAADHPDLALGPIRNAIELEPKDAESRTTLANVYRALHDWRKALDAANAAIELNDKLGDAYFSKACALAQLGRHKEAIAALRKSIELDDDEADSLEDENDLKPLADLPEFKKLLPAETGNDK